MHDQRIKIAGGGDERLQRIGRIVGKVPSGVFVLIANDEAGQPQVLLASWVQQAGFGPPAVSIALARERAIGKAIRQTGRLTISVLPADDTTLMRHFARGIETGQDPFVGIKLAKAPSGLPVLADAVGFMDCRLAQVFEFGGDHEVFLAIVEDGDVVHDGKPFTHVRGSGMHY